MLLNFSCVSKGPDLRVTLFRALPALGTCRACGKENDSGLWPVFTRKYVLAALRMYVWVSQGLFLSHNVNEVSCQLGRLVKWGRGEWGSLGWGGGGWVPRQLQNCNVLGYRLQEVLISRLITPPRAWEPIVSITLHRPCSEELFVTRQRAKVAAPETQFCAKVIMKTTARGFSAALQGQCGYQGGKYFPAWAVCVSV